MDFMDDAAPDALIEALGGAPDLVISDMAANTVGHPQTDHLRTIGLAETAAGFAVRHLLPGGAFLATVFAGGADRELRSEEHTTELQSLMRISYDVLCVNKKNIETNDI